MAAAVWAFLSGIPANGWTAIATWVLVVGTLVAIRWQVRAQRTGTTALLAEQHETNGVTVLLRLVDTWDGEPMRRNREHLKTPLTHTNALVGAIRVRKPMAPVAGFFEVVGLLLRRKVLDQEMVWSLFSYYVMYYFAALRDAIKHERDHDPTLYEEFEWLHEQMHSLDRKRRGEDPTPTPQEIRDFIQNEPNN